MAMAKSGLSYDCVSELRLRDLLLRRNSLHACIQTALVAVRGVLVQNALLHALVQDRRGFAVLGRCRGVVALGNRLAQQAQGSTQLALVRAVHRRLTNRLTCSLQ
jgi:hypothetical protein